jgi:hypothetical protein
MTDVDHLSAEECVGNYPFDKADAAASQGGRERPAITPAMVSAGVDAALTWISEYETGGVGLWELVSLIVRASLDAPNPNAQDSESIAYIG